MEEKKTGGTSHIAALDVITGETRPLQSLGSPTPSGIELHHKQPHENNLPESSRNISEDVHTADGMASAVVAWRVDACWRRRRRYTSSHVLDDCYKQIFRETKLQSHNHTSCVSFALSEFFPIT